MNGSIFQEAPSEIDETWEHGFLFGGMAQYYLLDIADAFKLAGDTLVEEALAGQEAWRLCHPILFNYRHSIELYLKVTLPDQNTPYSHNLARLLQMLDDYCQLRFDQHLPQWFKSVVLEFDTFDSKSTAFRYDGQLSTRHTKVLDEHWIDLHRLKVQMDKLQNAFHWLSKNSN